MAAQPRGRGACRLMASRILTVIEVLDLLPVSRTTLYRMERRGEFPRPRRISPGRKGYDEAEVIAWVKSNDLRRVIRPKGRPPRK
jgi:prophage regulatory protein